MVVALAMIYFLGRFQVVSSYTLIIAAFIGSLIATGFILLVSRRINHMATLLVAGIMIGYICSAVTDFVVTFAEDSDIVNLHGWSQGSFSGMNWSNVKVAAVVIGVTILITFFMSKPIGAYQLGEAYGCEYSLFQDYADTDFQCAFCMCDCICRTDFFRGNRCSLSGKEKSWNFPATDRHSCHIFGWRCLLYDV